MYEYRPGGRRWRIPSLCHERIEVTWTFRKAWTRSDDGARLYQKMGEFTWDPGTRHQNGTRAREIRRGRFGDLVGGTGLCVIRVMFEPPGSPEAFFVCI